MAQKSISILLLRILHGAFAVYFISCIFVLYHAVFTREISVIFYIALSSLVLEGFLVFVLNGGDCPLIHVQRKLDDPVPFFRLFLPEYLAKKAVPFFSAITIFGVILLVVRLVLKV